MWKWRPDVNGNLIWLSASRCYTVIWYIYCGFVHKSAKKKKIYFHDVSNDEDFWCLTTAQAGTCVSNLKVL